MTEQEKDYDIIVKESAIHKEILLPQLEGAKQIDNEILEQTEDSTRILFTIALPEESE